MKKNVAFLVLVLLLQSCKKEIKPLIFETKVTQGDYEADIEVAYDMANPNSEVAKTINNSIASKIIEVVPNAENATDIEGAVSAFEKSYVDFKDEFFDTERVWVLAIETEALYTSETIITMGISVYSDTGAAHGNDTILFLNLNPQTGQPLSQDEIIDDLNGFKTLARDYFIDHMKNDATSIEAIFYGKPFQLPENIGFNEEGVILLYNSYELASYNQGYTEFVIPMDKAQKFLKI